MRGRGLGTQWWQYAGLLVLAAVTVALCFVALTRDTEADAGSATDPPPSSEPSASASDDATDDPAEDADQSTTEDASKNTSKPPAQPTVKDQRRTDFTLGDEDLPDGSEIVDGGGNASGLGLTADGLTHGAPTGTGLAAGFLETRLESDVRALGMRVAFADGRSGSAAVVAWQSSIVESSSLSALPATGLRLVATPDSWTLSVVDTEETVLVKRSFKAEEGALAFEVLRNGDYLFVVDPNGKVTKASDPKVAELAGPYASWGLLETGPQQTPAVIESVWAG